MANYVNATLETTLSPNEIFKLEELCESIDIYAKTNKFQQKNKNLPYSFGFQWTTKEHDNMKLLFEDLSKKWKDETFKLSIKESADWHTVLAIWNIKNGIFEFIGKEVDYWIDTKYDALDEKLEDEIIQGIEYLKSLDVGKKFSKYETTIKVQTEDFMIDIWKEGHVVKVKNLRKKVVEKIESWQPVTPEETEELPF
jgi:hypothetical protein